MESQEPKQRKDLLPRAIFAVVLAAAIFGAVRLIGTNANTVFSQVESTDTYYGTDKRGSGASLKRASTSAMVASVLPDVLHAESPRKITQSSSFDLVVSQPAEAAQKIRALSERLGGYLISSEISGAEIRSASLTVRVPVNHAEEAKTEIRKLAIRVESEKTDAEDVTKQWVDTEAQIRNQQATEQQYLQILKRATSVKDTVEVTDKLSEIRGQIEQQQAEFAALSKRVETVAISVQLRADADVQVFGLHWRPLYRAKLSVREAIDALGDYTGTMFEVIVHIPVILLWAATLLAFAAVGWKLLRWAARIFFGWKPQPKP